MLRLSAAMTCASTNVSSSAGDDLRGFRNAGIGPRDSATRDALGGNKYYTGTAELRFPLNSSDDIGLRGAIFTVISASQV